MNSTLWYLSKMSSYEYSLNSFHSVFVTELDPGWARIEQNLPLDSILVGPSQLRLFNILWISLLFVVCFVASYQASYWSLLSPWQTCLCCVDSNHLYGVKITKFCMAFETKFSYNALTQPFADKGKLGCPVSTSSDANLPSAEDSDMFNLEEILKAWTWTSLMTQ